MSGHAAPRETGLIDQRFLPQARYRAEVIEPPPPASASKQPVIDLTESADLRDPAARDRFNDVKDALFIARLLDTLQHARGSSPDLNGIIEKEQAENGYAPFPLVTQAMFLMMGYMTFVYLKEGLFARLSEDIVFSEEVLESIERVAWNDDRKWTGAQIARTIRNALSHSRVEIHEKRFQFDDGVGSDPRYSIRMPWSTFGQLTMEVIVSGNRVL
jgi:hypothetical protein